MIISRVYMCRFVLNTKSCGSMGGMVVILLGQEIRIGEVIYRGDKCGTKCGSRLLSENSRVKGVENVDRFCDRS